MICPYPQGRDASEFVEASYEHHPKRDIEPKDSCAFEDLDPDEKRESPRMPLIYRVAMSYALGWEPSGNPPPPMSIMAERLGVSVEAISKQKRAIEEQYFGHKGRRKKRAAPQPERRPNTESANIQGSDSTEAQEAA